MTWRAWAALGVVYVVWGSTYLAIKVSVETMPPLLGGGVRFLVAGALVLLLVAVLRPRTLRVTRAQLGTAVLAGVLLPLGGNGLVGVAEQSIDSGLAALLVAAVPLWIVLLRWLFADRPNAITLVGVLVGFAGVAVLVSHGGARGHLGGALLVLVASLSWATGSYATTRLPMPANPFAGAGLEMLSGGIGMLLIGLVRGEGRGLDLAQVSGRSWLALGYLIVFGSLLAFSAYVWVLSVAPVSTVATYAYVNPAVAVFLGALVLGEPVTATVVAGGLVIVAAVAIVVTAEGRARRGAAPV
jgi:drug/metabolite transporter (DMT)-like permease